MKPTAGRIVLYWYADLASGYLESRPAIITSLEDDETVNLHVFFEPDDRDDVETEQIGVLTVSKEAGNFRRTVPKNTAEGDNIPADVGSWDWPPRV